MNNETLKRDLCARLMEGVKVQYEGILNGKERSKAYSEWKKRNEGNHILDYDEIDLPDELIGLKTAPLRRVIQYKNHWLVEAGIKQYKKFYNGIGVKPYLFPTSALTKPIRLANYNNGEPFVPIEIITTEANKREESSVCYSFINEVRDNWIHLSRGSYDDYERIPIWNIENKCSNAPNWIIELLQQWHINYSLSPDQFIEVTEENNPYV